MTTVFPCLLQLNSTQLNHVYEMTVGALEDLTPCQPPT